MNATDQIRSIIQTLSGEFCADNFRGCKSVSAVLNKLCDKGEIAHVGSRHRGAKPLKVYKVVKLSPVRVKRPGGTPRKKKVVSEPLYVTLWKKVYPEFFQEPKLKGVRRKVILETW